jgi:hypothetical protein
MWVKCKVKLGNSIVYGNCHLLEKVRNLNLTITH